MMMTMITAMDGDDAALTQTPIPMKMKTIQMTKATSPSSSCSKSKVANNVRALCDLSLVNPGQSPWVRSGKKKPKVFDEESSFWGFGKYKQRSDLESSQYQNDDCLQIQCNMKVVTGMPVMQSKAPFDVQVPPSDSLEDIRKFLEEEKKADVTFMVQDEVFHAHKFVLAMRTPFFDAELNNGARGGVSKRQYTTIEDMEPAVFKALLHFIYTDTLPAMNDLDEDSKEERVKSLLAAADRCGMERMKAHMRKHHVQGL
ncbi:hypothetical protein PR202_ga27674 [Eleusine coracana subsp. coracana]|uniref:BTB domain-containing protein n=1 Tax=Eleusine coracana subsp. coracana TaxID=191504 RepID=A0AAV5DH44_ELECO|nr:hypothetical protein PR202_ga27674 [Eleusine coracana subsp. coracana]